MKKLDLDEQKEILLDIMTDFDRVCRANGIGYSIAYGTLLGAVRHHGFIPWDDDVDVLVTRKDYSRMKGLLNSQLDENHYFVCAENDKRFAAPLAKIIDKRTLLRQLEHHSDRMDLGVYIDIFVLDYIPDDPEERLRILKKSVLKRKLWSFCGTVNEDNPAPVRFLRRLANKTLLARRIAVRTDKWAENNTADRNLMNILTFNDDRMERYIMEAADMKDLAEYEFEGKGFLGVKEYDKYLKLWYGDYMELPPEDKRVSHHITEVYRKDQ